MGLRSFASFDLEMKETVYPCTISNINGLLVTVIHTLENISMLLIWEGWEILQGTRLPQVGECDWTLFVVGVLGCRVVLSVKILLLIVVVMLVCHNVWKNFSLFSLAKDKETPWKYCFLALLGELDDSCCWFRVPKIYLDFVFDDKDLVTVYSNFGPNNKFVLDLSLKVPGFSLIIDYFSCHLQNTWEY